MDQTLIQPGSEWMCTIRRDRRLSRHTRMTDGVGAIHFVQPKKLGYLFGSANFFVNLHTPARANDLHVGSFRKELVNLICTVAGAIEYDMIAGDRGTKSPSWKCPLQLAQSGVEIASLLPDCQFDVSRLFRTINCEACGIRTSVA
jgi:hypothetical protein